MAKLNKEQKKTIVELIDYQVARGSNNMNYIEELLHKAAKEINKLNKLVKKLQSKTEVKMGD